MSVLTTSVARETLWASDSTASLLEEPQFSLGEGPCMQAATTGRAVMVPDVQGNGASMNWPGYGAPVIEQTDVRALFAVPLRWGVIDLGVPDLYRAAPGDLSSDQSHDLIGAMDLAALMMLEPHTDPDDPDGYDDSDAPWLDPALGRHAEIHQATGMVLAQLDITAVDALAQLRAFAFAHQRLMLDVAADVVARRLVFTEEMR